ncbi:DUF4258 domain-containing protein [Paenibacillus agilis]|uniref:DUF4258 domain-containing protein n=1 Tax=Paenibacillus agilis TaxID=3020863 RepID=A0A559IEF6_9BACL|nr:DUF4258 domain-containing protein [Paenibacillus agilis]TVX86039.1 DUF4258 domain-containing protein [Paenibacillus agilis]
MNEKVVFQMICSMIRDGAKIIETSHATQRMDERGIDKHDIVEILLNPTYIKDERKSSEYYGKDNYRIMGKYDWSVVVSVYFPEKLIVVTVID